MGAYSQYAIFPYAPDKVLAGPTPLSQLPLLFSALILPQKLHLCVTSPLSG